MKKYVLEKQFKVCWPKNCITCLLSSPQGLPSNRRSLGLNPPTRNIQHCIKFFLVFSFLWVIRACLDPDSRIWINWIRFQSEFGSETLMVYAIFWCKLFAPTYCTQKIHSTHKCCGSGPCSHIRDLLIWFFKRCTKIDFNLNLQGNMRALANFNIL